jgi:hypothetical protein
MNLLDLIGRRGEAIFAYLIGDRCFGRFWFSPDFLGDKAEALDHRVTLVEPSTFGASLYVQVKSTTRGYSGKGPRKRLKVRISKTNVGKLKMVPGPTYIAAIDIDAKVGYRRPSLGRLP